MPLSLEATRFSPQRTRARDAAPATEDTPSDEASKTAKAQAGDREKTEVRRDDETRESDRRSAAPQVETPARTPGSGVQMSNDMLVWMQGG